MPVHPNCVRASLVVVFTLLFIPRTSAQLLSLVPKGIGIETGVGHNQLFWSDNSPNYRPEFGTRTQLYVTPMVRVHYASSVSAHFGVYAFLGYNEFGGRSAQKPLGGRSDAMFRDRVRTQNVESGVVALWGISNLRFGIGAKINKHFRTTLRFKIDEPGRLDANSWSKPDDFFEKNFDRFSYDAGGRIEWHGTTPLILAAEAWFGLAEIASHSLEKGLDEIDIRQNHFRVMAGYRF